jgi:flagella basal body P-ring formation protein FlgA
MMRSLAAVALVALAALTCAPAARAQSATQVIAGKRFAALAEPAEKAVHLAGDAQLVPAGLVPDQIVPVGTVALVAANAIVTAAYVNVPIQIVVNGKFLRQVFVGYRVQRYAQTAVAARDLVPGTVLAPEDLLLARVVYTGQPINGTQALVGRRVIGTVRAGSPIAIENTQIDQIVRAGNTVTLVVDDNGVSVVADVVARTSGGLGDRVSVYNPQTNKTLTGTVVGPDRVELNLSGETL